MLSWPPSPTAAVVLKRRLIDSDIWTNVREYLAGQVLDCPAVRMGTFLALAQAV